MIGSRQVPRDCSIVNWGLTETTKEARLTNLDVEAAVSQWNSCLSVESRNNGPDEEKLALSSRLVRRFGLKQGMF